MNGGQAVRVLGKVESNGLETIPNLGRRHWMAGIPEHDSAGVGHSPEDIGGEAAQAIQAGDGLCQLGEPLVDLLALSSELFVFADRRFERLPIIRRGHTRVYTWCVNSCQLICRPRSCQGSPARTLVETP